MYEISEYINRKRKMSTAILKCPTGVYTIVGSVPIELTVPDTRSYTPGARKCLTWGTEQEAINALLSIGMTEFQLPNCQWYQETTHNA